MLTASEGAHLIHIHVIYRLGEGTLIIGEALTLGIYRSRGEGIEALIYLETSDQGYKEA